MNRVRYNPEAIEEFASSVRTYESESIQAAAKFAAEVARIEAIIAEEPKRYPKLDRRHRYVVLNKFPYYIVYLSKPGLTYIIAVAHASLPPNYWRKRKIV